MKGGKRMSEQIDKEKLLCYTIMEVAELCGICYKTAREMVNRSSFPKFRVGRRILIPKEAFHEWLKDGFYDE